MTISLSKGQKISLTKTSPSLNVVHVGLGWDPRVTDGATFDLDASIILCDASGQALSDENFVFYNNTTDPSGAVVHQGDNRTGEGDGDDEVVLITLSQVPDEVQKIVIAVSIDQAEERGQTFGQVAGSFVRLLDAENAGAEEIRYDLGEDFSTERSVVFAEVYRHNGEWKFNPVGQGFGEGLAGLLKTYGLMAA